MPRLLFEKTGNAVWMSHLDLVRVFQRAFKRAGLMLTHTQGYNPRPSVSIALPLSVGIESRCELLDFTLDGCDISNDEIRSRLNTALLSGIRILDVYEAGRKIRELSLLRCQIQMEYDREIPTNAEKMLQQLFSASDLTVTKKTKSGLQEQNIIPMIRQIIFSREGEQQISVEAIVCCQNPTLNPAQLVLAIAKYLPELGPDHSRISRIEIYDEHMTIFR